MLERIVIAVVLVVLGAPDVLAQRIVERPSKPRVDESTYMPPAGYVPDAATAIKIALAVWEPIYGRKQIRRQRPIVATLQNGVWLVRGSLPRGAVGGVAEADISKRDGRISRVIHGK